MPTPQFYTLLTPKCTGAGFTKWTSSGLPEEQVRKIVEDQARLLPDISCRIRTTWELVEQAKYGEVGIRNEKMLRYGVPRSAWTAGLTIEQWVSQIAVVLGSQVQELEASRTVNTDLSV